jgi:hypothetical protein
MTKTNSKADQLRAALKTAGYSRKQVTVKHDHYSMGSTLHVTIRDLSVSKANVTAIAESYSNVRRDQFGEILSGGNTYLDVSYEDKALREYAITVAVPQLVEIPDGQSRDVLIMGQSIKVAKVVNDRTSWQSEIVALDYQCDPELRVRCYYDTKQASADDMIGAGKQLVELAIELAWRASVSAAIATVNAEIEAELAPAHDVEQRIPVIAAPSSGTEAAALEASEDWSAGL